MYDCFLCVRVFFTFSFRVVMRGRGGGALGPKSQVFKVLELSSLVTLGFSGPGKILRTVGMGLKVHPQAWQPHESL